MRALIGAVVLVIIIKIILIGICIGIVGMRCGIAGIVRFFLREIVLAIILQLLRKCCEFLVLQRIVLELAAPFPPVRCAARK